jgi:hypothetical protein
MRRFEGEAGGEDEMWGEGEFQGNLKGILVGDEKFDEFV